MARLTRFLGDQNLFFSWVS